MATLHIFAMIQSTDTPLPIPLNNKHQLMALCEENHNLMHYTHTGGVHNFQQYGPLFGTNPRFFFHFLNGNHKLSPPCFYTFSE